MLTQVWLTAGLDSFLRGQLGLGPGSLLCLLPILILPILTLSHALALCEYLGVFECFKQAIWVWGGD